MLLISCSQNLGILFGIYNEKINQFNLFLNMESSVSKVDLAIEQMGQSQFSNNSIGTVVTSINEVVNDAARKCFATKNHKKIKIIREIADIKDGLIRTVKRQKKTYYYLQNLQRFPKDPIVRGRYHKLKKQYKRVIKDKEHAFCKKMLDSISQCEKNNPKLFWDMVNRLRSCKNKNLADNIDQEEWYKWFRDLNRPQFTINKWHKTVEGVVKGSKDFTCFSEGLDKSISNDEIIKASRRLENHKAVGYDSICNEMIKCLVKIKFINVVRSLFNAICLKSYFPKYRGISVSSCLGKLFTLIMNERLIKVLDDKNVLSDCQIGFRRNHRTSDHIFILNTVLNSYFSRGKRVYACFVDSQKHMTLSSELVYCTNLFFMG